MLHSKRDEWSLAPRLPGTSPSWHLAFRHCPHRGQIRQDGDASCAAADDGGKGASARHPLRRRRHECPRRSAGRWKGIPSGNTSPVCCSVSRLFDAVGRCLTRRRLLIGGVAFGIRDSSKCVVPDSIRPRYPTRSCCAVCAFCMGRRAQEVPDFIRPSWLLHARMAEERFGKPAGGGTPATSDLRRRGRCGMMDSTNDKGARTNG